ncbi:ROK family protein, partial [bacterium]|nr:ROK family protein [bacterium]
VVIGGGVAQAGDLILEPCREEAARVILGEASKAVPIVPAELGPEAAALGAAALAREEVAGT